MGFHVSAAGYTEVAPGQHYPPRRHPDHHQFRWETGRVLTAFQLIFISAGSGCIESKRGEGQTVEPGSCILIMPGVWHRYRPDPGRGWTEHWFELQGRYLDEWVANGTIDADLKFVQLGARHGVMERFQEIHTLVQRKSAGYRPLLAGLAFTIVMEALSQAPLLRRRKQDGVSRLVRDVQRHLHRTGEEFVPLSRLAGEFGTTYPTLLRRFRRETGLNPREYFEQVRMSRAESLLMAGDMSIKEIASFLGFHSAFHFSAQFRKRHGLPPSVWRRRWQS